MVCTCVPSNSMANRRKPKFSLNNCAHSSKTTFMCLKFCTNPVLKHTKCHICINLSNFLKLCLLYCKKLFALAPTNRRFAENNQVSGKTGLHLMQAKTILEMIYVETLSAFTKLVNKTSNFKFK